MDDLDRMFRRLVQNVRNGYPEYLTHPFEVSELYQNLIPYRHNRRELEIDSNQDYEVALCRLISGERGYLKAESVVAESIRRELASPNPNTAIFREFAASRVALSPDAQWRWQELGGDIASTPTLSTPATPAPPPPPPPWEGGRYATGAMESPADTERNAPPPPAAPPPAPAAATGAPRVVPRASGATTSMDNAAGGPTSCRYCGGTLPIGRAVAFCPHCGQNLTIQRCPACGTEMEINWKYCITCGRGVATP
ncbi:MAG TPA: zinc ribbon domain-containing protein [Gemmatimonadaceae bacterium]|nr:zinc ribbon domain-containing protein [Gemmatimonadaceae bacterium]